MKLGLNNQGQVLHTGPNKHADKNIQITVFKNRLKMRQNEQNCILGN